MSASREKKQRQNPADLSERERKRLEEEQKTGRNRKIYIAVGVVIAILALTLIVWDSNFFQSRATAVTIGGEKYTAADLQYFYSTVYQNETASAPTEGEGAFDADLDPTEQVKDTSSGQTWQDYLIDKTIESLKRYAALEQQAKAEGYVLSDEAKEYKKSLTTSIDSSWRSAGFTSRSAFVRAQYGPYMSEKKFLSLLDRDVLVMYYAQDKQQSFTYTDAEYDEYYELNSINLDTYVYDQFTFRAALPAAEKDADGNDIERTDEEKAELLEDAKAEMKELAEEFKERLDDGEDARELIKEYEDSLYSSLFSEERLGSSVNSSLSVWLYTDSRLAGDTTVAEYDSGSDTYNYYVARFERRYLNEDPTANVRHALIPAGEAPTDEQYAQAEEKAEKLLEEWKAGEATEDTFAELARKNSADTGSAARGGLMENVSPDSGYVEAFTNWSLNPKRQSGDTGIVQNTGSSIKGWHIMYFVDWADPVWKLTATNAMQAEDMEEWATEQEDALEVVKWTATRFVSNGR